MQAGRVGESLRARELFELVHEDLQRVEAEIGLESVASVKAITTISRYLHSSGGKRLRPTLLLLAAKLAGDGNGSPSAIRLAAVVEMIHTATLVHDDVIDVAQTRRGRPSTNVIWGNHASVLAGDWLYMQAFQVALRERNFQVLDILIALTQMMVEGELLQLERIGSLEVTEADYMDLVDRKTASLFSACARLGALTAGAECAVQEKLAEYAWNLGMAFQLVDDVLDFTAAETVLGKPVGSDLREGKVTLPLIYALQGATREERARVECILRDHSYERVPFAEVLDLIRRRRGVERAMARAEAFTETARGLINDFPDSPYQRALYTLTELVTERDH
ncbi:MAG: polyprenyl synthetase family protein [Bryobacterales bacterium]|nr:polyprenyl synthetase family protein [Bryobacteraceae bacterium]MDW8353344.1 polyprenyl synthetase family protein [Bryobacterales bacterium]